MADRNNLLYCLKSYALKKKTYPKYLCLYIYIIQKEKETNFENQSQREMEGLLAISWKQYGG